MPLKKRFSTETTEAKGEGKEDGHVLAGVGEAGKNEESHKSCQVGTIGSITRKKEKARDEGHEKQKSHDALVGEHVEELVVRGGDDGSRVGKRRSRVSLEIGSLVVHVGRREGMDAIPEEGTGGHHVHANTPDMETSKGREGFVKIESHQQEQATSGNEGNLPPAPGVEAEKIDDAREGGQPGGTGTGKDKPHDEKQP